MSSLPGCYGWPCYVVERDGHVARIWQDSPYTHPNGVRWHWSLDDGRVEEVHGNRGTAKVVAAAALRRVVAGETSR